MKYFVMFSLLLSSVAFAEGEVKKAAEGEANKAAEATISAAPKPEETVTLSEEATAPLFERIRGAHLRAQQAGKVVASTTMTVAP